VREKDSEPAVIRGGRFNLSFLATPSAAPVIRPAFQDLRPVLSLPAEPGMQRCAKFQLFRRMYLSKGLLI